MLDEIKKLIEQKNFTKLENIWMEMLENKDIPLKDFFVIAQELKKVQESRQALLLLEVLATHFESLNELKNTIEVYKHMVYYTNDDIPIRKKLVTLYKKLNKDSIHIDEYIEISGIEKGESIFKSLEKLAEFLKFDIGNWFYFAHYGIGEVVEVIPTKKEMVINFEKKGKEFIKFDIAKGLLIPISREHFLYKKSKDIEELRTLASSNPAQLIKFILRSFSQPMTASQIKCHLTGIFEKEELNRQWERVRKVLETDDNIKIEGKTQKTYTYVESGFNKLETAVIAFREASPREKYILAEGYARKDRFVFDKIQAQLIEMGNKIYGANPALALDVLLLFKDLKIEDKISYTVDEIFGNAKPEDIIKDLNSLEHQKILLKAIKERNPETWLDIFKNLCLSIDDIRLLNEIEEDLKSHPDELNEIYKTIFTLSKHYPKQFQWLLKKIANGELREYLNAISITKIITSLEYVKDIKPVVMKILNLEDFDSILKIGSDEDARRLLSAIQNNMNLADYEKKDFLRIIEYNFPHLFKKEEEVIYTTQEAYNKKKEELNRLLTIDIPENKKEISRAREYGDLSENFEYKAARERQSQLYQRLRTIEHELQVVRIIDTKSIDVGKISVGTKVTLRDLKNDELTVYTILGRWDTDLKKNIISNESPIGKTLLDKVVGERVLLDEKEYEVRNIEKGL